MANGASSDEWIEIGVVARAHGVRGELRVHLHNPGSTALERAGQVKLGGRAVTLDGARRVAKDAVLVRVAGVDDRTQAEALRGRTVEVSRDDLALEEDEVLLGDLVGCAAFLPDGRPWGVVTAIQTGPQDRLVIRDGDVERQVPAVDALLVEVDVAGRRVVVDPPEGLPEEPVPAEERAGRGPEGRGP